MSSNEELRAIIQELGRSILLLGGRTDILSTVWSIGDTISNTDVLDLLRSVNDAKEKEYALSHGPYQPDIYQSDMPLTRRERGLPE